MKKYILTLINISIALAIWTVPAIYFNAPGPLFVTWVFSLLIYKELDEASK
jgi:F0F1-type ATP synthase assembly protein I